MKGFPLAVSQQRLQSGCAEMTSNTTAAVQIYQPLDVTQKQFRLLRVKHDVTDGIVCELKVTSLDTQPVYTALSYAWTNEPPRYQILLNGAPFFLRPNLYHYLEQFRIEKCTEWMFIDAICVNQQDEDEKADQIGIMGAIYTHAQVVIAWMGNFAAQDEVLSNELYRLMPRIVASSDHQLSQAAIPELTPGALASIVYAFMPWRYWSRLWMVQEIVLAQYLILQSSAFRLRSTAALNLLRTFWREKSYDTEDRHASPFAGSLKSNEGTGYIMATDLLLYRDKLRNEKREATPSLFDVITKLTGQQSTLPHDRIFGLLGLVRSSIKPNYSMPILELYLRVWIEDLLAEHEPTGRMAFHRNLAAALQLPAVLPLVAFVTMESLRLRVPEGSDLMVSSTYTLMLAPTAHGRFWKLRMLQASLKFGLIHLKLSRARSKNQLLKEPGDKGRAMKLEEWASLVASIYTDVERRVCEINQQQIKKPSS